MITVESSANPVYSSANGERKSKRQAKPLTERQTNRMTRRSVRKAKRLKKVKLRSGKTANVYVLTKIFPKKTNFDGDSFSYADDQISTLTQSENFIKTNADGTIETVAKEDVVKSSTGAFYDKNEVAKVYMVDKATVTQPMIDRITVAVVATGDNLNTSEEQKTNLSDLGIIVDDKNTKLDENGELFLKFDVEAGAENMTEAQKAEIAKKQAEEDKKARTRKVLIWSAVGIGILIAGIFVFRKMSKGK